MCRLPCQLTHLLLHCVPPPIYADLESHCHAVFLHSFCGFLKTLQMEWNTSHWRATSIVIWLRGTSYCRLTTRVRSVYTYRAWWSATSLCHVYSHVTLSCVQPRHSVMCKPTSLCHVYSHVTLSCVLLCNWFNGKCLISGLHLSCWQIADFGLSRDVANDEIYQSRGGLIPLRWTAPEVRDGGNPHSPPCKARPHFTACNTHTHRH